MSFYALSVGVNAATLECPLKQNIDAAEEISVKVRDIVCDQDPATKKKMLYSLQI